MACWGWAAGWAGWATELIVTVGRAGDLCGDVKGGRETMMLEWGTVRLGDPVTQSERGTQGQSRADGVRGRRGDDELETWTDTVRRQRQAGAK